MSAYCAGGSQAGHNLKESEAGRRPGVHSAAPKCPQRPKSSFDLPDHVPSQPLRTPLARMTGLKGKYCSSSIFSAYVPMDKERQQGDPPPPRSSSPTMLPKQLV